MDMDTPPPFARLLLTGAAGALGKVLRQELRRDTRVLRLSDVASLGSAAAGEELMPCDLADKEAVDAVVQGCDAIVHLGGVATEQPFERVLEANIRGTFHVYEAARRHGVRRVVFASSNHVTGFHPVGEVLDADAPRRPDGYYGLSKSFGEDLSRFYFDRYGIESACLRIGSCYPEPRDRRMLVTWQSPGDLTALVRRCLRVANLGHAVVYGVSDNRELWWDNWLAAHLDYAPRDSSEPFRERIEAAQRAAPQDKAAQFQGGAFVQAGPFESK